MMYVTAELIDASEQGIQLINTVVTRSARIIHPTEVGKEIIVQGLVDFPLKLVSPPEGKEEKKFKIPPFEGGKKIILAKINGSEFEVEQKKNANISRYYGIKPDQGLIRSLGFITRN
ncbi:hypothetical protein NPIL_252351 [Nephila pilipes]|uniref:Uncharacterized protein n=1 Tax=Nephila pilipes TaxID=299642 RepID=A0A8X6TCU4_NEPPI|nr:hypothetical protein NPIL_252351 [Nephila pilipes]